MKPMTKYLIIGALAGLANGLFGSGGGLFLVPLLIAWTHMPEKKAFATSVAIVVPLSVVSLAVVIWRGGLDIATAWPYWIGGAAGGLVSGWLFSKVSATVLHRVFGVLLLYGGLRAVLLL